MKAWLDLIRWPNLILILVAHILFRFSFLTSFNIVSHLSLIDFILLSFTIVLVAISGNIINDIYDIKTDFINKRLRPIAQQKINISQAYLVYVLINITSIILATYLSFKHEIWYLVGVEISVIILLFSYSKTFKKIPVLGNIIVSFLVSLAFVLVIIVDSDFKVFKIIQAQQWLIFYTVFAFWANFNRELIKDVIDIKGDYAQNISTLPIVLGKSRMNTIIFFSTLILMLTLLYGVKVFLEAKPIFIIYFIFGIGVPLIAILYKIWKREMKVNYKLLSNIYKFVLLSGLCSLILFSL